MWCMLFYMHFDGREDDAIVKERKKNKWLAFSCLLIIKFFLDKWDEKNVTKQKIKKKQIRKSF